MSTRSLLERLWAATEHAAPAAGELVGPVTVHMVQPPTGLPPVPTYCQDCEGEALTWGYQIVGSRGITEGRHKLNELTVLVYLGCDGCSATVFTEDISQHLARLDGAIATLKARTIAQAENWRVIRDLVHSIDDESRPGACIADDDVLEMLTMVLSRYRKDTKATSQGTT